MCNFEHLLETLAEIAETVNPCLRKHNHKVAYISFLLAKEANLSPEQCRKIYIAGILHNICGLDEHTLSVDIIDILDLSTTQKDYARELLENVTLLKPIVPIIQDHHDLITGVYPGARNDLTWFISFACQLDGHFSDYTQLPAPQQINEFINKFKERSAIVFPELFYDLFARLCRKEFFYLALSSDDINAMLRYISPVKHEVVLLSDLRELSMCISELVDIFSNFTMRHSRCVGVVAKCIGELAGLDAMTCEELEISGYLHDLGKLKIPQNIIHKTDKLTNDEFSLIKSHVWESLNILKNISGIENIIHWAICHHERLDGSGYPFKYKGDELDNGCRIMAVADMFTALAEDRPYRPGFNVDEILAILQNDAQKGLLDNTIVASVSEHRQHVYNAYSNTVSTIKSKAAGMEGYFLTCL